MTSTAPHFAPGRVPNDFHRLTSRRGPAWPAASRAAKTPRNERGAHNRRSPRLQGLDGQRVLAICRDGPERRAALIHLRRAAAGMCSQELVSCTRRRLRLAVRPVLVESSASVTSTSARLALREPTTPPDGARNAGPSRTRRAATPPL
jgi:hypothetical protein